MSASAVSRVSTGRLRRIGDVAVPVLTASFLRASRRYAVGCLVCVVLTALIPAGLMVVSGGLISAVAAADATRAVRMVGLFAGISVAYAVLNAVLTTAQSGLSQRFVIMVDAELAESTLAPVRVDGLESPALRREIDVATETSREGVHLAAVAAYVQSLRWRISGLAATALLAWYSWWAAVVLLAGYAILTWAFRRWLATVYGHLLQVMESGRRRPDYLRRVLSEPAAAKEIRVFGALPWLDAQYGQTWTSAMTAVWKRRRAAMLPLMAGVVALLTAHGVVFGWLALRALNGGIAVGAVVVIIQAAAGMEDLSRYGDAGVQVSRARTAVGYLNQLRSDLDPHRLTSTNSHPNKGADPDTDTHDTDSHNDLAGVGGRRHSGIASGTVSHISDRVHGLTGSRPAVELRRVRFTYPSRDRPILDGLDLTIPAGQTVAVVGENGAGKSTLVKLLTGLYAADSGTVIIDGNHVTESSAPPVGVIFQAFGRYEMSLRDNVALGNLAARDDDTAIRRALNRAGGSDLLEICDLDTVLSAGYPEGRDLSGGQWQRVALARALSTLDRGAKLLILDEPTAALDVRAEIEVFRQFVEQTQDVTTIIISHRLGSVRLADRIVLLHDGRIAEDGTHDQLLAADGRYAQMFHLQASRFLDKLGANHA